MRAGRTGAFGSDREVIQAAFGGVTARKRRVVGHAGGGPTHTRRHALANGGPFGWAYDVGDSAETITGLATCVTAARSGMRAMQGRIPRGSIGVIRATAERVSGRVGIHARRHCCSRRHAAFLARILGIRPRAVGHDVRAVFLGNRHHAAAGARAGIAGTARGR